MSYSIYKKKKKNGQTVYTGQVRIMRQGKKYSESKTSSDKKFVEEWAKLRDKTLSKDGAFEAATQKGTTLGRVLEWYRDDFQGASKFGRSKLSHINYLIDLHEFANLDAINLTAKDLIKHAHRRATTASPSTILNDFIWLSNAMKAVRLSRDLPLNLQAVEDAMQLLRRERVIAKSKQRDRRPTLDELNRLLEYFNDRDGRATLPMVDIVLFALFSSRRQEEVCSIQWADLDERRKGVLVRDMKHPTKKIDTFTFLTNEAWEIIQRQPKTDDRIFPYVSKSVSAAFTRSCSFLEIENLRFHDLRHECVSWLFELGWDIPKVSSASGHKSWSSLQRYTHLRDHEYDKYEGWKWRPVID